MKKYIFTIILLIIMITIPNFGIAGTESITLNKKIFKPKEMIKVKCEGLNKKISYKIAVYRDGRIASGPKYINSSVSGLKYFKAPVEPNNYTLRLTNNKTNQIYATKRLRVTSEISTPSNNKIFTASSGTTDLNYADTVAFINGYKGLGYTFKKYTKTMKVQQLKSFLMAKNNMHFNSGHGNPGSLNCVDGSLKVSNLKGLVNVQYCIFATCLTLKHDGWYDAFGSNAKMIMGFTEVTTDASCLAMAKGFPTKLKQGQSYLKAWYLTNSVIKQHQDRWATFVKEGSKIVLYSAKGKKPIIIGEDAIVTLSDHVAAHKRKLKKWKQEFFGRSYYLAILGKEQKKLKYKNFPTNTVNFTAKKAEDIAVDTLMDNLPDDAELDNVIPIEKCNKSNECSVVAYDVHFMQKYGGFPIRSNFITNHISILVGNKGVTSTNIRWSNIVPLSDNVGSENTLLSVGEALINVSDEIANIVKKPLIIVSYERVYGVSIDGDKNNVIVPSYEYIGNNGERFVVNAFNGELLK